MAFPLRKMMMSRGKVTLPDSANMSMAVGESLGTPSRWVTEGPHYSGPWVRVNQEVGDVRMLWWPAIPRWCFDLDIEVAGREL